VAVAVLIVFGGIFWGVLPQAGPVSWEGHLSGAAAGFWAARKNRR
jgi:membrane associated rhomboid family serine protease